MATRRVGQAGQIDYQGRGHFERPDCGSYRLVRRVGPGTWEVQWTAPCDDGSHNSTLRFVSRDQYARYF